MTRGWPALALCVLAALAHEARAADAPPARRSGAEFMSPALQALQADPAQNPAQLWVKDGEALWARACAGCHAEGSQRGMAARHPAWDERLARPVTLAERIAQCRQRHQHLPSESPEGPDGPELLALAAYLAEASRGLPWAPPDDSRLKPWQQRGERLWQQRLGQLNLACTQCHDQHAGAKLGGATIPQAHPTGYPSYRLEWQTLGSLPRRLRGCLVGVRAEPFAPGADEWLALEVFLAQRAAGMALEGPSVRP
jgi:sulfur-oxidizing protein SoxA